MSVLSVRHVTTYRYRQAVSFGEHRLMFRPRDSYDQRLLDVALDIAPEPAGLRWVHDVFGNCVTVASFGAVRAMELRFESRIRLEHLHDNALDFALERSAATHPFAYRAEEVPDLGRCIERHYPDPDGTIADWAWQFLNRAGPTDTRRLLTDMTHAIRSRFTYVAREEAGVQSPAQTLRKGSGSCRDFAVLMMEAVRSLGLAARFVSGYLYSPARAGRRNVGGGATHAWMQVYLPGAGWVEFDPTNGIVGNRDLIRVAVARDPSQAVPLSGTWTGFPSDALGMEVDVEVRAEPEAETVPTDETGEPWAAGGRAASGP